MKYLVIPLLKELNYNCHRGTPKNKVINSKNFCLNKFQTFKNTAKAKTPLGCFKATSIFGHFKFRCIK